MAGSAQALQAAAWPGGGAQRPQSHEWPPGRATSQASATRIYRPCLSLVRAASPEEPVPQDKCLFQAWTWTARDPSEGEAASPSSDCGHPVLGHLCFLERPVAYGAQVDTTTYTTFCVSERLSDAFRIERFSHFLQMTKGSLRRGRDLPERPGVQQKQFSDQPLCPEVT